ncbi:tubulin-tyrosine ligase, partial [Plasmodium falciparum RAJ116]
MSIYFRELFPSNKVVKFRTDFRNTIFDLFLHRKWELTNHETDWNLCWSEKDWINEVYDTICFKSDQYVNHYRNYYELTRKDLLAKNIKRLKKQYEKTKNEDDIRNLDITPMTFVLPLEYKIFSEEYKKKSNRIWIMKPIGKSQGKGIFLFDKISQIKDWNSYQNKNKINDDKDKEKEKPEQYIVQEYISNPLLIGGKKFDIRLYVLILSYYPLTIYIYRSGFARFSHTYFKNEKTNMNDVTMHLTNVSIQKNAEGYDDTVGGKWFVRELFLYMISRYGYENITILIKNIEECIIQSFLA